jgi:hypothetical protein
VSDDDDAAELLDEVDVQAVSIIWAEGADDIEVCHSGCSVYEAIGMTVVAALRLLATEAYPYIDDEEEEEDE